MLDLSECHRGFRYFLVEFGAGTPMLVPVVFEGFDSNWVCFREDSGAIAINLDLYGVTWELFNTWELAYMSFQSHVQSAGVSDFPVGIGEPD